MALYSDDEDEVIYKEQTQKPLHLSSNDSYISPTQPTQPPDEDDSSSSSVTENPFANLKAMITSVSTTEPPQRDQKNQLENHNDDESPFAEELSDEEEITAHVPLSTKDQSSAFAEEKETLQVSQKARSSKQGFSTSVTRSRFLLRPPPTNATKRKPQPIKKNNPIKTIAVSRRSIVGTRPKHWGLPSTGSARAPRRRGQTNFSLRPSNSQANHRVSLENSVFSPSQKRQPSTPATPQTISFAPSFAARTTQEESTDDVAGLEEDARVFESPIMARSSCLRNSGKRTSSGALARRLAAIRQSRKVDRLRLANTEPSASDPRQGKRAFHVTVLGPFHAANKAGIGSTALAYLHEKNQLAWFTTHGTASDEELIVYNPIIYSNQGDLHIIATQLAEAAKGLSQTPEALRARYGVVSD